MIRSIAWTTALMAVLAWMQSTIIQKIAVFGVIPDIALIVLVFCAIKNGSMAGQISGFLSGLAFDPISGAPLGFNVLVRTVIGHLYGVFHQKFFIDAFLGPFLLVFTATLLRAGTGALVGLLFPGSITFYPSMWQNVLLESLYNALISPVVFFILGLFKRLFLAEGRTF